MKSVDWVKCNYESHYGKIISNWSIEKDQFNWEVSIPVNTTARVYVSGNHITESGLAVEDCELPPCGKTALHIYKNVELWTQPLLLNRKKKKKMTERQIICPVANETNKLQVVEANPGNLLQL